MEVKDLAAWLGERLDKLEEKVDSTKDHCGQMEITLTGQAKDLAYHIARTDALEERVEQVASDLKPVKEHVARLKGGAAVLGILATLLSVVHWFLK